MINYPLLLSISKIHLLSRVKQSLIAALGVTFGIGFFITLLSFMTGVNKMLDDLVLSSTPHIHLYTEIDKDKLQPIETIPFYKDYLQFILNKKPKEPSKKIPNSLEIINSLRNRPEVYSVAPKLNTQVFFMSGANQFNGTLTGIDPLEEDKISDLSKNIVEGKLNDLNTYTNGIILGQGLADKVQVVKGDNVTISTPTGSILILKVIAISQTGMAMIDENQGFVSLKTAQKILQQSSSFITDINIKLYDKEEALYFSKIYQKKYDVKAIDFIEANAQFTIGNTIRGTITYAVGFTLLLVAGFGIYNILNMMIYEKMNDIAILKATGFSAKDVRFIFISQAMIIGLVGGLAGLLLGLTLSTGISFIPFETKAIPTIKTFPVNFNPLYYLLALVFALITTFLAGFMPAKRASKIDPVEIIRGQ